MSPETIAYLGPRGTFTEEAVNLLSPEKALPVGSVAEALDLVVSKKADRAVIPVENSIEGSVSATSDALAHIPGIQIYSEHLIPVRFVLASKGKKLDQIEKVLTHPVAYAQARKWLSENIGSHQHIPAASTAAAAMSLSETDIADAAVVAPAAAEIYGLEVLATDIGENKNAQTRFIEVGLASKAPARTGKDKTSLIVELPDDKPGGLLEMLEQFSVRGINLSRLESRPIGDAFGRYRFYVDAQGHLDDEAIGEAMMGLHRFSPKVTFLGSYPRADQQESVHLGNNVDKSYNDAKAWLDSLAGD